MSSLCGEEEEERRKKKQEEQLIHFFGDNKQARTAGGAEFIGWRKLPNLPETGIKKERERGGPKMAEYQEK